MSISALRKLERLNGGRLSLGKAIQAIRLGEELSQTEFAETLQVSRQYLCDLEHDRKEVSPQKALQLAQRIGYSEKQFVRLALQDMLIRQGIPYLIDLR